MRFRLNEEMYEWHNNVRGNILGELTFLKFRSDFRTMQILIKSPYLDL